MASLETVRIHDADLPGGKLINKSDFNEKEHTLHGSAARSSKGTGSGAASRKIVRDGAKNPARKAAKADAKSKKAAKAPEAAAVNKGTPSEK